MTDDLHKSLRTWLESEGYPLEMEAARIFRAYKFGVQQSLYYEDLETGKHRELDVFASVRNIRGSPSIQISVLAECKVVKDKPVVVFTGEHMLKTWNVPSLWPSTRDALAVTTASLLASGVQAAPLLHLPARIGYSAVQAFRQHDKKGDAPPDVAYAATMGVAKAALWTVRWIEKTTPDLLQVVWPLIVLRGKLFESYLTPRGDLVITPTISSRMVWRNPALQTEPVLIDIVCEDALEMYCRGAYETADRILSLSDPETT
jgi:hypothetical protein